MHLTENRLAFPGYDQTNQNACGLFSLYLTVAYVCHVHCGCDTAHLLQVTLRLFDTYCVLPKIPCSIKPSLCPFHVCLLRHCPLCFGRSGIFTFLRHRPLRDSQKSTARDWGFSTKPWLKVDCCLELRAFGFQARCHERFCSKRYKSSNFWLANTTELCPCRCAAKGTYLPSIF